MAIERIAVIGCGRMGLGITECAATAGISVVAVKLTPGDLEGPRASLAKSLDRRVKKGKLTAAERTEILGRVSFHSDLAALPGVPLIIESCIEDFKLKAGVLQRLEAAADADAIIATNTSSLRLADLSNTLSDGSRFVGLHFFNPVPAMRLVEIGQLADTAPRVVEACESVCGAMGKTTITVQPQPGYVVNRLLVPYLLHAIETLEHGVADAEAIDTAMKLGCGYPMGPLALADLIGLDVVFAMAKTMHTELRDSRYRAPSLLRRLVLAGDLGRKSQRGIYDYTGEAITVNSTARVELRDIAAG
jgi:3-hydroxybutyryl-CoA dehydrogenase